MKTFHPGVYDEVDLDDFLYFIGWSIFILLISSEVNSENDTFLGNHAFHLNVQKVFAQKRLKYSPFCSLTLCPLGLPCTVSGVLKSLIINLSLLASPVSDNI